MRAEEPEGNGDTQGSEGAGSQVQQKQQPAFQLCLEMTDSGILGLTLTTAHSLSVADAGMLPRVPDSCRAPSIGQHSLLAV